METLQRLPTEAEAEAAAASLLNVQPAKTAKRKAKTKANKSKLKSKPKPKPKAEQLVMHPLDATITKIVKGNPKRPGSKAAKRFAVYRTGMTVQQALKGGARRDDLRWDIAHGWIKITGGKKS